MENLIEPHGGQLVNLFCPRDKADDLKKESIEYPSLNLGSSQLFDLELLMNGGFSPLRGFMTRRQYESVLEDAALPSGLVWPIPIYLDVPEKRAGELETGRKVALRDMEGFMLAIMTVRDIWKPDKTKEALQIYGTDSLDHPGVARLFNSLGDWYVGGEIIGAAYPIHFDYKMLRMSPRETRYLFRKLGWRKIIAFETHGPFHNAHKEMTLKAAMDHGANIFLNPIVGLTHPSDLDHYTRVRCCEAIIKNYPPDSVVLSLLPLAMRLAGPREALWHAIIRKNYGCSHFMVAEDHADPHAFSDEKRFYPYNAAQQYVAEHEESTGVTMVELKKMVYLPARAQYLPLDECKDEESHTFQELSAVELKRRLDADLDIPAWYSPPEVVEVLRKAYPPRSKRGFSIFLTGLSGSGKSTLAKVMMSRFMQIGERPVTLLDGDIVRKNLSSELGFSRNHRELNITRIGFVASEIVKNRGIAICAPIAAIADARRHNRHLISGYGGYVEVYVSTPLEVCEMRDRKGLYAKARAGILKGFTGIDDPYEIPVNPEVTVDTSNITPYEAVQEIMLYLKKEGYLG